ncbi:FtsX-like permease family protein [Streptomyces sp. NPDC003719]
MLDTRERIHDLGVCKAIGMSPRQVLSLVLALVAVIGALLGGPAGYALHHVVMPVMGRAVGTGLPSLVLDVYGPFQLLLLGLGGVVIAMLGALIPAGWAARARTATALRTEWRPAERKPRERIRRARRPYRSALSFETPASANHAGADRPARLKGAQAPGLGPALDGRAPAAGGRQPGKQDLRSGRAVHCVGECSTSAADTPHRKTMSTRPPTIRRTVPQGARRDLSLSR